MSLDSGEWFSGHPSPAFAFRYSAPTAVSYTAKIKDVSGFGLGPMIYNLHAPGPPHRYPRDPLPWGRAHAARALYERSMPSSV